MQFPEKLERSELSELCPRSMRDPALKLLKRTGQLNKEHPPACRLNGVKRVLNERFSHCPLGRKGEDERGIALCSLTEDRDPDLLTQHNERLASKVEDGGNGVNR
jgi:hypothetical protein